MHEDIEIYLGFSQDHHQSTTLSYKRVGTMAMSVAGAGARLSQFLLQRPLLSTTSQPWTSRTLLSASITIPAISINLPGLISDIWDGLLKAVPKKKTSHMKRRHRQLAGKALKDVTAVNTCPGCGQPKRAHFLCPHCVKSKLHLGAFVA